MKNFEKKLEELENIIKKLEDENTPLEDSLNLYTKGIILIKELNTILNNIEGKVQIVRNKLESDELTLENITEIFKDNSNLKNTFKDNESKKSNKEEPNKENIEKKEKDLF